MRSQLLIASFIMLAACKPHAPAPVPLKPTAAQPAHAEGHTMPPLPATVAAWAKGARLFDNLGDFHRQANTASDEAQRYFDQGMRLLWAFNHDESTRSFARAAEIDPGCGMCYWGVALTVGPNYNLPFMAEPRAKVAAEALDLARKHADKVSAVDKALIDALAKRYPNAQPLDPANSAPVLTAYAQAMREVARKFPNDLDAQTLFAESLMNLNAWKLWTLDGKPAPGTKEIQATLEKILARDSRHPGANHYYMHTMEASPTPGKALPSAERVGDMMPAAGHLVHMPSHIMQRVGRYDEAAQANRKAAEADAAYFKDTQPPDYYAMYWGHNYQFLAYSAAMEGRRAETLDAVRNSRRVSPDEMLLMMPGADWFVAHQYAALVRFGLWDEMLAMPAPNPKLLAMSGGYLFGKGVALAAKGQVSEAKATLGELQSLIAKLPADAGAGYNLAKDVLDIGALLVESRIATAESRVADSIALLRDAAAREDKLAYDEPKDWFFPVRHLLGAELLSAGRAAEAAAVYREDLKQNPANGWSLFGLTAALKATNKSEAAKVEQEFKKAWERSDIKLTASAF